MSPDLTADAPRFIAEFGENCVYVPGQGDARNIRAVIDRDPPAVINEATGKTLTPFAVIHVVNSADEQTVGSLTFAGIASSEIDTGRDKVTYAARIGKTATSRPIKQIAESDAGILTLELR